MNVLEKILEEIKKEKNSYEADPHGTIAKDWSTQKKSSVLT